MANGSTFPAIIYPYPDSSGDTIALFFPTVLLGQFLTYTTAPTPEVKKCNAYLYTKSDSDCNYLAV